MVESNSTGKSELRASDVALRLRDIDDLNHAMAGLDVGRQRRHLPEGSFETAKSQQKKSEREAMTALQLMLLTDSAYAALRARVQETLSDADARLAALHLEAEAMLSESAAQLEALEARAGELPDGTKVFRSADGDVFRADGTALDAEERAEVSWKTDAPSWEDYSSAVHSHRRAVDYADAATQAQQRVDEARDTLQNDQNNPTTAGELENIERGVQQDLQQLEKMRLQVTTSTLSPSELTADFNAKSPDLNIAALSPAEGHSVNTSPH